MKTYKEIFAANGIAAIFATYYENEFANLFDGNTVENVDTYVLHKYGGKWLVDSVVEKGIAIVKSIIALNLSKWTAIKKAIDTEYSLTASGNETRVKTGTLSRENTNESTAISAEKAFNDTEFVGDSQNTHESNGTGVDTYNLTETVTRGNGAATLNVDNEIKLRQKLSFQYDIIADIINEITLRIY